MFHAVVESIEMGFPGLRQVSDAFPLRNSYEFCISTVVKRLQGRPAAPQVKYRQLSHFYAAEDILVVRYFCSFFKNGKGFVNKLLGKDFVDWFQAQANMRIRLDEALQQVKILFYELTCPAVISIHEVVDDLTGIYIRVPQQAGNQVGPEFRKFASAALVGGLLHDPDRFVLPERPDVGL